MLSTKRTTTTTTTTTVASARPPPSKWAGSLRSLERDIKNASVLPAPRAPSSAVDMVSGIVSYGMSSKIVAIVIVPWTDQLLLVAVLALFISLALRLVATWVHGRYDADGTDDKRRIWLVGSYVLLMLHGVAFYTFINVTLEMITLWFAPLPGRQLVAWIGMAATVAAVLGVLLLPNMAVAAGTAWSA
jgi:hypothetical protein